jgi:predicted enzyme related to lactoylglutathione lyase
MVDGGNSNWYVSLSTDSHQERIMPVTGIGGLFFRAEDPKALVAWYKRHLGIGSYDWEQSAGPTVVAPFAKSTDYFAADKQWMLNLRVSELDAFVEELSAAGIAVLKNPERDTPETGRFARIHDPEGNAIEPWEPPAA